MFCITLENIICYEPHQEISILKVYYSRRQMNQQGVRGDWYLENPVSKGG